MKLAKFILLTLTFATFALIIGCGPSTVNTAQENLNAESRPWIPYAGNESVVYEYDTSNWAFTGTGKDIYYENVRYMSDQSGFFKVQEDYYAELERQELNLDSPHTPYFIKYYLERNKGETGDWDVIRISVGDGDYYKNEMKIVTYESDDFDKGENYKSYFPTKVLNGITFDSVYYSEQERRPFGVYYNKRYGVVAFKVSSAELWTIKLDK